MAELGTALTVCTQEALILQLQCAISISAVVFFFPPSENASIICICCHEHEKHDELLPCHVGQSGVVSFMPCASVVLGTSLSSLSKLSSSFRSSQTAFK